MTNKEVTDIVESIFIRHFDIQQNQFDLEQPLEILEKDFRVLGNLVFLEQLLQKEFKKNIPLLENISSAFHTPQDIVNLVMKEL